MDKYPNSHFNSPKDPDSNGNSLEKKDVPPHLTIEYYKNKSNGIERNIDDVLEAVLFRLATKDKHEFETDCKSYDKHINDINIDKVLDFDALSIKDILQLSYLPNLSGDSLEEFMSSVESFEYFRVGNSHLQNYLDRLSESDRKFFLKEQNRFQENGLNYWRLVENGEFKGLKQVRSGGIPAISTETYDAESKKGYRVNIKVSPLTPETPDFILSELVKRLFERKDAMEAGFKIKVMAGESSTRDGIIIYTKVPSFTDVADVVTKYFDDNPDYHDRHADKGIMFGTPLESADRRKFPGIRVTTNPREPFDTFNFLQAGIVSPAVINYVRKYYHGDHTKMLRHFGDDYYEAFLQWEQHFPTLYKNAVKEVCGSGQQVDNIAFLGE